MASLTAPAETLTDAEILTSLLDIEASELKAKERKGPLSPQLKMGKDQSLRRERVPSLGRERGVSVSGLQTQPRPKIAKQSVSDSLGKLRSRDLAQNSTRKSLFSYTVARFY